MDSRGEPEGLPAHHTPWPLQEDHFQLTSHYKVCDDTDWHKFYLEVRHRFQVLGDRPGVGSGAHGTVVEGFVGDIQHW